MRARRNGKTQISKPTVVEDAITKLADRDYEVRMEAAENLAYLLEGRSSPRELIDALKDKNELVRIEVAESLGFIGDPKALPALRKALEDRSPLVRSYVAAAIGLLGSEQDLVRLKRALKQESSETAKIGVYLALYTMGEHAVLEDWVKLLQSADYRVRCAAANNLSSVKANKSEAQFIRRSIKEALRKEDTTAARSSMRSSLRALACG